MAFIAAALLFAAALLPGAAAHTAENHQAHCMATDNVFEFSLDLFASEWGEFKVLARVPYS